MSYFSCRQLRMAALNRPSSGNMDGINSINYACYREVRNMEINPLLFCCGNNMGVLFYTYDQGKVNINIYLESFYVDCWSLIALFLIILLPPNYSCISLKYWAKFVMCWSGLKFQAIWTIINIDWNLNQSWKLWCYWTKSFLIPALHVNSINSIFMNPCHMPA